MFQWKWQTDEEVLTNGRDANNFDLYKPSVSNSLKFRASLQSIIVKQLKTYIIFNIIRIMFALYTETHGYHLRRTLVAILLFSQFSMYFAKVYRSWFMQVLFWTMIQILILILSGWNYKRATIKRWKFWFGNCKLIIFYSHCFTGFPISAFAVKFLCTSFFPIVVEAHNEMLGLYVGDRGRAKSNNLSIDLNVHNNKRCAQFTPTITDFPVTS